MKSITEKRPAQDHDANLGLGSGSNAAAGAMTTRPPLPPFTRETAIQKVRLAEDGWNSREPEKVALAYALNSRWRNRAIPGVIVPLISEANGNAIFRLSTDQESPEA